MLLIILTACDQELAQWSHLKKVKSRFTAIILTVACRQEMIKLHLKVDSESERAPRIRAISSNTLILSMISYFCILMHTFASLCETNNVGLICSRHFMLLSLVFFFFFDHLVTLKREFSGTEEIGSLLLRKLESSQCEAVLLTHV